MAQVKNLKNLLKNSVTASHHLYVQNTKLGSDFKFQLNNLFPVISNTGTAGVTIHSGLTNTSQFNLRQIAATSTSVDSGNRALTSTLHNDGHILLTLVESVLDLNLCDNSSAGFLKTVNLATNVGATILPVANGGTGIATLTANGVLIGNGTSAVTAVDMSTKGGILVGDGSGNPQALAVGTNDYVLTADSSTATGLAWKAVTGAGAALTATLDTGNNNIDLGTGWLSGDGSNNKGINIDSAGKVFAGTGTASFNSEFNINGDIEFLGGSGQPSATLSLKAVTSGTGGHLIATAGSSSSGNGGYLYLNAGSSTGGNGVGGNVEISAGLRDGTGARNGSIEFAVYNRTNALVTVNDKSSSLILDDNLDATIKYGNAIFHTPTKGIVYTSRGDVTQLTNHSTSVTSNATAGIITLAAVSLATGTETEFRVVNSAAQADSLILLTVESPNASTSTDDSIIIAQIASKSDGNFDIILKNIGDASTDASARKIHYMIINNSV